MFSIRTPAKINLFLNVRPPQGDGYHEICSVMQAIQLWDELIFEPNLSDEGLRFTCNVPEFEIESENNLVVKAYHAFWRMTKLPRIGLRVHLEKNIPWQAGLGGGSSDAAATLAVLNHLSLANLPIESLRQIAATLGSDVPFFLTGGTALTSGRGERIEPVLMDYPVSLTLVVIQPRSIRISTQSAYDLLRRQGDYAVASPEHLLRALAPGRLQPQDLDSYLYNDFERVLFTEMPELKAVADRMKDAGISRPLLCGSGSALAGFLEANPQNRSRIQEQFPVNEYFINWCRTHVGAWTQTASPANV